MDVSPFKSKIVPFFKKWEKFILGAIDILAITIAFQCSYYINYTELGGFFFRYIKLLKLFSLILPFWLVILYLIQITEIPRTKRPGCFLWNICNQQY